MVRGIDTEQVAPGVLKLATRAENARLLNRGGAPSGATALQLSLARSRPPPVRPFDRSCVRQI